MSDSGRRPREDDGQDGGERKRRRNVWGGGATEDSSSTGNVKVPPPPSGGIGLADNDALKASIAEEAAKAAAMLKSGVKPAAPEKRLSHRVYVGSLHYDLKEADVRAVFEPFGTIVSMDMSYEPRTGKSKGFCFLEYAQEEDAQKAMQTMNGFLLAGRPIKVGPPNGVAGGGGGMMGGMQQAQAGIFAQMGVQQMMGGMVNRPNAMATAQVGPPTRLYVGSIMFDLGEAEIRAIFEPFGAIKNVSLIPNPETGKHKGYGFVEYETHDAATLACQSMNGFELAGRQLKVNWSNAATGGSAQMAVPPTGIAATAAAGAALAAQGIMGMAGGAAQSVAEAENPSISGQSDRYKLMQRLAEPKGSKVVCLANMITEADCDDPELEGEIKDECQKFGSINKIHIHKSQDPKIYVVYDQEDGATNARKTLDGRWFDGRKVLATYYEEEKFNSSIFE